MSEHRLRKWLSGSQKVAMIGIGNPLRMDDYVGMKIVEDLKGKLTESVLLIESETVPESFLQQIIDFGPSHVLLIDAAVMGEKPGTIRMTDCSKLTGFSPISSHALPLRVFCQCLQENLNTNIVLLLIEPKNTDFGEDMSTEVRDAKEKIERQMIKYFSGSPTKVRK